MIHTIAHHVKTYAGASTIALIKNANVSETPRFAELYESPL